MKTLQNTKTHKMKTTEIVFSNMTFIVELSCHYMAALNNPGWSTIKYRASIKETGKGIGGFGGKNLITRQMELINSRPDLFLS